MSIEAAQQFLDKASQDEQLAQEIAKAIEAGESDNGQTITTLAKSKGYECTSEELRAEFQKRTSELQERQNSGEELSEQDLEAVAGGATPVSLLTKVAVSVATKKAADRW